jgi:photosystem II stability/assembly factor-like uncharacterized protein
MFCSIATISSLSNKPNVAPILFTGTGVNITSRVTADPINGFGSNNFGHYICTSNSGQYMYLLRKSAAAITVGVSNDYGVSFTLINTPIPVVGSIVGICCSSNGMYVGILTNYRSVWLSSDYGVSWTDVGTSISNQGWTDITMSSTGQYICACVNGGAIYLSSNYGSSWTNVGSIFVSKAWTTIAMSSTGQYICVAAWNGPIYLSTDYGSTPTWANIGNIVGTKNWGGLAMSSTGQYIICSTQGHITDQLYVNNNYGNSANWVSKLKSQTPNDFLYSSISSDGSFQVTVSCTNGYLYYSSNYGNTWTKLTTLGSHYFSGLAVSGNHKYVVTFTNGESSGNKVFLIT